MMRSCEMLYLVLVLGTMIAGVVGERNINMDSPTACGNTFPASEREVFIVKPRGSVGVSNPPSSCAVFFESSQSSSNYKFEITIEAANIRDCGMMLRIFNGKSTSGSDIRSIGCASTATTGHEYSKDSSIALLLTRTQNQWYFGSDFQLRIQLFEYQSADTTSEYQSANTTSGTCTCDRHVRNVIIVSVVLGFIVIVLAVYSGYITIMMKRIKEKPPFQIENTPVYINEHRRNELESAERHDSSLNNASRTVNDVAHPPVPSYARLNELTRQNMTDYSELS